MQGERILLTGCTGFVGKFVLRELCLRTESKTTIICLLRGRKGQTVADRWNSIRAASLYKYVDLSKVEIQEGDLDNLEGIEWAEDKQPTLIVHCAANVKTLDTYENLYRDNVLGVETLCQAVLSWSSTAEITPRVLLVSTCYVHPRKTVGKAELLPKGLSKDIFTTDYTYTKYLGEHAAASFSDRLPITILRLSCVGAPFGWLDAHPTPAAMAHLGIISLVLRGRLEHARVPSTMKLSTIPVDIVAKSIVDECTSKPTETVGQDIRVKQICADSDSPWNLSMSRLYKTIQRLSPNLNLQIYDMSREDFENQLAYKMGYRAYTPWGAKEYIFHKEVNQFIDKFADGQTFESTVPAAYFPNMTSSTEESIYEQTCFYVARGNHQHILEKGLPMPLLDKFWSSMANHIIECQILYREPLSFSNKAEAEEQIFSSFSSHRVCFTDPDSKFLRYDGNMGPLIGWTYEEAVKEFRPFQVQILGTYDNITGVKIRTHHGIGDGLTYMMYVLPRLDSLKAEVPRQTIQTPSAKPRGLSMTQELWCFIYYFAMLVKLICSPPPLQSSRATSDVQTIEMATTSIHKDSGLSFTVSLLKRSYPVLRSILKRDTVVYCIPAAIEGPAQRGLSIPRNSFAPLIIPWSANGSEIQEQLLSSKAVKAVSSLLTYIISLTEFYYIRDMFMQHVDVVYSSLLGSDSPLHTIKSAHFLSPTPAPIPFTICAGTIGSETHLTIASKLESVPAKKIMNEILRI